MSIEMVPVLENHAENEFGLAAEWRTLAHSMGLMEGVAESLGVVPLDAFISYTRAQALESLGDDGVFALEESAVSQDGAWFRSDGTMLWSQSAQWFAPEDGLQTARALIEYSNTHGEHFTDFFDATSAIAILRELETVLAQAQAENTRFHLRFYG